MKIIINQILSTCILSVGCFIISFGQTPRIELSIENTGNNHIKVMMEVIDPNGDLVNNWNSALLALRIPLNGIEPGIPRTDGSGYASDPDITNFTTGFDGAPLQDIFLFNIATYTPSDQNMSDDGYMYIMLTSGASPGVVNDGDVFCLVEFDLPASWECNQCVEIASGASPFFTPTSLNPLLINDKEGDVTVIVNSTTSLPIELTAFETRTNACDVSLYWETATEQNFGYYQIEASRDGRRFEAIAEQKPASPNSLTPRQYKYAVPQKYQGHYFRLRSVDLDGSFEFSPVVFAETPCKQDEKYNMKLYPNPNYTSELMVEVYSPQVEENVQLHLTDAFGKLIRIQKTNLEVGVNKIPIETNDLPSGNYFIKVIGVAQLAEPVKFVRSSF